VKRDTYSIQNPIAIVEEYEVSALNLMFDETDSLIRRLIRITECFDRNLLAGFQLTPSQASTLEAMADLGEVSMNGLADEMRLHGTTMTRMVDALVRRGMAERLADPRDRRVVRVRLTDAGLQATEEVRRRKRDTMRTAMKSAAEADWQSSLEGLRRAVALAEQWGNGCC
jgi:DNA-binding MarR family transcriptional regulator